MRPDRFASGLEAADARSSGVPAPPGAALALLILAGIVASVAGPHEACPTGEGDGWGLYTGPCRALVLPAGPTGFP